MLKQIQPYCVFFNNEMDEEAKNELFNKLKNNYKYSEIYLPEVISNAVKRKILEMPPLVPEGEISKINLTLEQKIYFSIKNCFLLKKKKNQNLK